MEILLYTFYLLILFSFIFLVGFSFLRIVNYQSIFFLEFITGVSIILILSNFFYFFLNISLSEILLLFFIYFIFSFLYLILYFKKNILNFFFRLELLLIFIPVFCGILIALYYGEQFYVFRGNHYDHTWYVANSVLIKKFRFLEYYNFFKSNDLFFVIKNLDQNLYERPAAALFMSFFLFPKFVDIFFSAFIFKFFLVSLSGLSFIYFVKSYIKKKILNKIILFLFFCFSFWTLYIFEIDALSQLFFLSYFIFLIKFFSETYLDENINKKKIILFIINFSAAFLIYPQQFLILLFISAIYFILYYRNRILFLFYAHYKIILTSIFLFFLLTFPHHQATYGDFYKTYRLSTIKVDWWGYYGAFILGRDSIILNRDFVEIIKETIKNYDSIIVAIKSIVNFSIDNKFYFIFFNIPISLLGFYFLTPGAGINLVNIFLFFICGFLIYYVFKNIYNNLKIILKSSDYKIKFLYFSAIISFLFIFLINLLDARIWQIFKLYFFYSFFLIVLIIFRLHIKNKNIYFKIDYLLVLILLLFPVYKYSVFNNGIGRYDSFPSITNINLKNKIYWSVSEKEVTSCSKIYIEDINMDEISKRYIFSKLINLDIKFDLFKNNNDLKDKDCKIILDNGFFKILKH